MDAGQSVSVVDEATLTRAAATLRRGGLVAFPTETVYGLGAHALDETAVARIFAVKGRPHFDPLIVHVAEAAEARPLTADWPDLAQRLAEAFWPGPLTLVLPKAGASGAGRPPTPAVPDLVTAGLPTVALRVPAHPLARALLRAAGVPVAAPSANRFGGVSPTTAAHVHTELGDQVEMVLDGGPCQTGVESTVLSLIDPARPRVLRLGGVAVEAIEAAIGQVTVARPRAAEPTAAQRGQQSPGMLERHYAPRTPMRLAEGDSFPDIPHPESGQSLTAGLLVFSQTADQAAARWQHQKVDIAAVETLSPAGDLVEAAANLFAAMRRLDAASLDLIVAEPVPERGLGRAINDRLRRAATR